MINKVLVLGDIHDDIESLTAMADYAEAMSIDQIICLGDYLLRPYKLEHLNEFINSVVEYGGRITTTGAGKFIEQKRAHSKRILKEMKSILDQTGIPYLTIGGNYDPSGNDSTMLDLFGKNIIENSTSKIGEAKVFCYGGSNEFPDHIRLLVRINEIAQMNEQDLARQLNYHQPDILILHTPPYGLVDNTFNGQNVGSKAARQYIESNSPNVVFAGHIHEAGPLGDNPRKVKGVAKYGDTYVLNPGNLGRFETLNPHTLVTQMQFDFGTFIIVELDDTGKPQSLTQYSLQADDRRIGDVKVLDSYNLQ